MHLLEQFISLRYELIDSLTAWVNNSYFIPPEAMAIVLDKASQDISLYEDLGNGRFYYNCDQIKHILSFASHELRKKQRLTRDILRIMDNLVVRLRQLQIN
ncbi:hypothetical protein POX_g08635 [Penicillium oxalicum]|uniref:Uncharacterized protein n=1 Tax=Penicillium oxalicum (strain 114-2 / CGMCC 5302) TaxID=933388 RepID=S7Z8Y0_PENO1|nr:hypothetical protein POX_g08635 [Penicillium oxalicum]EPS27065.1 hypothetical protein PDE_02006 [Penicillium oxalicum 114-2]KAI2786252.1 hypothetical protein POX_g08635 [Penicillium oxalicum]